jgi:hypothetical protein
MGKIIVNNMYGGDIEIESICSICKKVHKYRIKERKICDSPTCYEESKRRYERDKKHPLYT